MAAKNDAFDSPDTVELKGKVTGVTRLSKKAKAIVGLVGFAVLGFILFAIFTVDSANEADEAANKQAAEEAAQAGKKGPEPAKPGDVFKGVGDGQASYANGGPLDPNGAGALGPGFNVDGAPVLLKKEADASAPSGGVRVPSTASTKLDNAEAPSSQPAQKTPEQLAADSLKERRRQLRDQARDADLEVGGMSSSMAAVPSAGALVQTNGSTNQGGVGAAMAGRAPEQDDQNKQVRKENFLKDAENQPYQTYLKEAKRPALSPYELKAGWAIPAALGCGINSDLPGQICGQVRENVYDSTTGRYLLIPQGTRLIGTYDSQVAVGQERILAVWNRLIFPDGSSISLQGMPGANQAGYAGFDADVDNHYIKVFGGAIMLSMITAGVQLSQPQQSANSNSAPSTQQTIAGALGQQLGQVGSSMVQRNMQIQPTLKQKPGYRFNVMVTRDIIFPGAYGKK